MPSRKKASSTSARRRRAVSTKRAAVAAADSLPPPIVDIPASEVGRIVQGFINDRVKKLEVHEQTNALFTITLLQ